jgi:hypothetical protein
MTRDEYVESIKSAFVTVGSKGVIGVLAAQVPFFGAGFGYKLADFIIKFVLEKVVALAEMQVFFMYIDMRTAAQAEEFIKAANENRKAQESGTPEEKKNAESNLINKFRDFAKFTR